MIGELVGNEAGRHKRAVADGIGFRCSRDNRISVFRVCSEAECQPVPHAVYDLLRVTVYPVVFFLFKCLRQVAAHLLLVHVYQRHHVSTPAQTITRRCSSTAMPHSNRSSGRGMWSSPCRCMSGMNCCSGTSSEENCSCSDVQKAAKTLIIEFTSSCLDFSALKTTARRWVNRNDVAHLHADTSHSAAEMEHSAAAHKAIKSQNSV